MGDAGAQILDVRDAGEYAKGHRGRRHQYRAGRPICNVGLHGAGSNASHRNRGRAGARRRGSFVPGKDWLRPCERPLEKMAWKKLAQRPDLVWSTNRVSRDDAGGRTGFSQNPPLVVDIRGPREWNTKHHRRQREYTAHPLAGASGRDSTCNKQNRRPLRGRIPVINCRQYS